MFFRSIFKQFHARHPWLTKRMDRYVVEKEHKLSSMNPGLTKDVPVLERVNKDEQMDTPETKAGGRPVSTLNKQNSRQFHLEVKIHTRNSSITNKVFTRYSTISKIG